MKIWLPDSLYRAKPLFIGLLGAILLYVSNDLFTTGFAFVCLGFASWIIVIRLMWSTAGMIKSKIGSVNAGEQKTHYANFPDKVSHR